MALHQRLALCSAELLLPVSVPVADQSHTICGHCVLSSGFVFDCFMEDTSNVLVTIMKSPENGLSARGWANVGDIMPRISTAVNERSRADNPNIDLASSENWLLRPELLHLCVEAVSSRLCAQDLSYPRAFAGFPEVLEAFAGFFNSYFHPHLPVEVAHLATAPGAASCLDTLFYNICDPGDGILVPAPYWSMCMLIKRLRPF